MKPHPDNYLRVRWDIAGFRVRVLKLSASAVARLLGVTQPAVTSAEVRGYTSLQWYKALHADISMDEEATVKVFAGKQPNQPTPEVLQLAKRFDTKHPAIRFILPDAAKAKSDEAVPIPRNRAPAGLPALPRTVPTGIDGRRLDLVINHRRRGYPEQSILQHYVWEGGIKEFRRYLELTYDWFPELRPAVSRTDAAPSSAEEAVDLLSRLLASATQSRAVLEAKVERLQSEVLTARERADAAEAGEARAITARQEVERDMASLRESMAEAVHQRDEALEISSPPSLVPVPSPEAVAFIEKHAAAPTVKQLREEIAALPKSKGHRR